MAYITDLTLTDALALQGARDADPLPRTRGIPFGIGRHVTMPETWDGAGDTPFGWTGEPGVYEQYELEPNEAPNPFPPPATLTAEAWVATGLFCVWFSERSLPLLSTSAVSPAGEARVLEILGLPPEQRPPKPNGPPRTP
jgi:hypothetical protein